MSNLETTNTDKELLDHLMIIYRVNQLEKGFIE